jgi:hypothetical protein
MNSIYELVISVLGNPITENEELVAYIVSGILFLFIGFNL